MTTPHDSTVPLTIRQGTACDAEILADFQQRMAFETEGMNLDASRLAAGVRAVFDDPRLGTYWVAEQRVAEQEVAEQEEQVVGCLLTVPEWSDWRNGTVLWIHSVYVLPEARGLGVYKALYRHLQHRVHESGDLRGLRLYVDKRNHAAQRAYEALGMTAEHYRLYEWLPHG